MYNYIIRLTDNYNSLEGISMATMEEKMGALTKLMQDGILTPDEFANVVASISTTRVGGKDSCPSLDEVNHILNDLIRKRKI